MKQNAQAFQVEFDAESDSWIVKIPGQDVACGSKADADRIASLSVLYSETLSNSLYTADEHKRRAFRDSAKMVVRLVNQYGASNPASRAVERELIRIEECLNE